MTGGGVAFWKGVGVGVAVGFGVGVGVTRGAAVATGVRERIKSPAKAVSRKNTFDPLDLGLMEEVVQVGAASSSLSHPF